MVPAQWSCFFSCDGKIFVDYSSCFRGTAGFYCGPRLLFISIPVLFLNCDLNLWSELLATRMSLGHVLWGMRTCFLSLLSIQLFMPLCSKCERYGYWHIYNANADLVKRSSPSVMLRASLLFEIHDFHWFARVFCNDIVEMWHDLTNIINKLLQIFVPTVTDTALNTKEALIMGINTTFHSEALDWWVQYLFRKCQYF